MKITRHRIKGMKRGFPSYPSNGLMPTKHLVELDGDKIWRRVYDRYDGRKFVPLVKLGVCFADLSPQQKKQIGYSFATARED